MMGFGGIFGILLIALIVWAVIQLVNNNNAGDLFTSRSQAPLTDNGNALDILKKRYARGEIDREDYERMKQEIS